MKRFIFGLVAMLMMAVIMIASVGCHWDHDEWMELVNSVDETVTAETSVAVNEAVPKLHDEEGILLSDLHLNFTNNRNHIESEVFAVWQSTIVENNSTIVENNSFVFIMPISGLQQDFG